MIGDIKKEINSLLFSNEEIRNKYVSDQWEFYINNNCDESCYPYTKIETQEEIDRFDEWVIESVEIRC